MRSGRSRLVALAAVLTIGVTSCGGAGSEGSATSDVSVTMKDFSLTATPGTFAAGAISFGIDNAGPSVHEFVVLRTDDTPDALPVQNGVIPEDQIDLVDEVEDIPPGTETSLDVNLAAGNYVLVCNLPAHYEQGMYAVFTVA